jgi:hypothetical protein
MIFISETKIEDELKELLQKKVRFKINNKTWKTGRFILFKQSGFFIECTVRSSKTERFEIPIPFDIKTSKTEMVFDYRFSTLTNNNKSLIELIDQFPSNKKSRFYNNILTAHIDNEEI